MAVRLKFREVNTTDEFYIFMSLINYKPHVSGEAREQITLYENAVDSYENIPNKPTWDELANGTIQKTYEYVSNPRVTLRISYSRQNGSTERNPYTQGEGVFYLNNNYTFLYFGGSSKISYWSSWSRSFLAPYLYYDINKKQVYSSQQYVSTFESSFINDSYDYVTVTTILASRITPIKYTWTSGTDVYIGSQKINNISKDKVTASIGAKILYPTHVWITDTRYNLYDELFNYTSIPTYPDQNPDGDDGSDGQPNPDPPLPGDGDTSSDPLPDPPPQPLWDVTDTGFVVIYNPTVQEIRQLAYFMWSGDFADLIKKVFAEPFAALISLKMLFCPVETGASQTVWLGNVETDVSMSKVTKQFTDIDLGTVSITEFFGSFADYAPFTKIQIFLPFIGYKDLNVDEVMNSQLHLRYRIDVYSGACIAFLTVTKDIKSTHLNSILYQFDGNCAMEIPFTSNDNSRYVSAILNSAASSALSLANNSSFSPAQTPYMFDKGENAKFTLGSLAPVANGMLDILSVKPNVQRAGSLAGAVASMGVKQPYIIIHRPIQHMPANYQHFIGIPLNLSRKLSEVKGYTIISQVFISSQIATDEEITMITELLKSGVIL